MTTKTRVAAFISAILLLTCMVAVANAGKGDCGQPVSTGSKPTASDALAILRTVVGLQTCELCVCDVNDKDAITVADALAVLRVAVDQPVTLDCPACSGTDSDSDGLSDDDEILLYHSDPNDADSDDDGINDGQEVKQYRTSPALADTDGDGMDDREEILTGGRSPRLADLPQLKLELSGDPNIRLDVDYTTGRMEENETLVRNDEQRVDTDSVATKMSIENTIKLHTETEGGTGKWPPSFNAKLETDTKFHHGYFHDTSSSWKQESSESLQNKYSDWEQEIVKYNSGGIAVAMKVLNQSGLSFKVKSLVLNAYRDDGGGHFTAIDTLIPDPTAWPEGGHLLGPGGSFTMMSKRDISDASMMKSLVKNPTGLLFEVGSYSIFRMDPTGQFEELDYDILGETVVQRTGTLIIDYGQGTVERYMVATNLERDAYGNGKGVTMAEALSAIIGVSYATAEQIDPDTGEPTGKVVLSGIRNVTEFRDSQNPAIHGFWTVAGTDPDFDVGQADDFESIMLRQSQLVTLVYLRDSDGDGIYDREEYLLGTDKLATDSDDDGLSDYEESKVGWAVAPVGKVIYQAYPDPRVADADADGLSDPDEKELGTDPFLQDTDSDGTWDPFDWFPLEPACLSTIAENLVSWWDGSYTIVAPDTDEETVRAIDLWGTYALEPPHPLDGTVVAADPRRVMRTVDKDPLFLLNPGPDQHDQYIAVPHDTSIDPPAGGFTVYAKIAWQGTAIGSNEGTVIAKGPDATATYRLLIKNDGTLVFSLYRHAHTKAWFTTWWPWPISEWSWDDGLCADDVADDVQTVSTPAGTIKQGVVTEIAATYQHIERLRSAADTDFMSLYVGGIATPFTKEFGYHSGMCHSCCTRKVLNTLHLNGSELRIGGGPVQGEGLIGTPYRGTVDDVQFFNRPLNTSEVLEGLIEMSICRPETL